MGLEVLKHNVDIANHAKKYYDNDENLHKQYQNTTPGLKSYKDIEPFDIFKIAPGTLIFSVLLQRMVLLPDMEYIEIIGKSDIKYGDIVVFNILNCEDDEFEPDLTAGAFDVNYTYLLPSDIKRRSDFLRLDNDKINIL